MDDDWKLPPGGHADGALTMAEQWQLVFEWRSWLASPHAAGLPAAASLSKAWELGQSAISGETWDVGSMQMSIPLDPREELDFLSDETPPIAVMFDFIAEGVIPPPELMLAVLAAWRGYLAAAAGKGEGVEMEVAFCGKRTQRAGNYAKRAAAADAKMARRWTYARYRRDGMPVAEAADAVAALWEKDGDSLMRRELRGFYGGWRRGKPKKMDK